jgi:hypothetical protein
MEQILYVILLELARAACSTVKVKYVSVLVSVHREASGALCKGNHAIFRTGVQLYTRASEHARVPGLLIPSADIEGNWVWAPCCKNLHPGAHAFARYLPPCRCNFYHTSSVRAVQRS